MRRIYTHGISIEERNLFNFLSEKGNIIFSTKEIKTFRLFKNCTTLLMNLKRKGLITQVERGKYILSNRDVDSFLIGTRLVEPSAIAYSSALNYYGLTEQIPNIIHIQTSKRKQNKEILNVRYQFITISPHKFFGIRKEWIGRDSYFITDIEKTIVDCFDLPEYAGGFTEAVKGLFVSHERLDKEKLWQYALKMENNTLIKRLGYLSEILNLKGFEDFRANAAQVLLPKYTLLNPLSSAKGKHLKKWRLIVNHTESEIYTMAGTAL